jgi:UDP-N-acetylmuramoyl-tripeptide--D-alanyl-D-alanine ligase
MRIWEIERVAQAAGAKVVGRPRGQARPTGPENVSIDSRTVGPGELFVGLEGEHADGGRYAVQAMQAGAWGVLVKPEHAKSIASAKDDGGDGVHLEGVVLAHVNPLEGLQELAKAWLKELREDGARVVAVTGSTGKTSTKDIVAALLAGHLKTVASPENQNTEIGLPLAILSAPAKTEALVLEMAMRGKGQIAELTKIAEPDVGVIVNVGPVHLEQMGSIEGVAEAKAELIAELAPGTTVVVPADEPLLEPYRRKDVETVTFGPGGDVLLKGCNEDGEAVIDDGGEEIVLKVSFKQAVNLQRNLPAAVAAARALGVTPEGEVRVRFSKMRGERKELPGGRGVLIEDCYNANPMSMRAAIDDLATTTPGRKVAVLGDMLELGREAGRYHREIGEYAAENGVDVLITVGGIASEMAKTFAGETHAVPDADAAAELLEKLVRPGDTVLVKGSRGVGLERVAEALTVPEPAQTGGV